MALARKGTTLLLEALILIYMFTALIDDINLQASSVNASMTGSVLVRSVLVLVLIVAMVYQIFTASGIGGR